MEELLNKRIGKVHVVCKMEPDEYPDLSWIGTFSDQWKEGCLEWNGGRNSYKYFHPQPGLEEYAERDMARMKAYDRGEWMMVGVIATVYVNGAEIGHDSLWGIEYDYSVQDYHIEVMRDVVWRAIKETREWLAELQID